jgi:signal transduction histidine kinase
MALPVAAPANARVRDRTRALTPWWAAALALPLVVAAAVKLALSSDHLAHPATTAAYRAYLIAGPALIGLAWWRRRPASAYGPLLVLLGLAALPLALESSNTTGLVVAGVLSEPVYFGLCVFVLVAFPRARLRTAVERRLVAGCVLSTLLFYVPSLLFLPALPAGGLTPSVACAPACPPNPLQVATLPRVAETTGRVAAALVLLATVALAALLVTRLRRATRPQRREIGAIVATAFPCFPALGLLCVATLVGAPAATLSTLGWVLTVAAMLFTLGFLVALLQAELFAGAALRRLLTELAARPVPARWRDAVAAALGDGSLRLGFWDPARRVFREADGATLERPTAEGRRYTPVEHAGDPVAAITTDEALGEQPELLQAAAKATLVAVRTGHLEGELRDSRLRLLAAGNAERRRIQRDLHDSAQQRLVALRIRLDLMSDTIDAPSATRAALGDLGDAVEETIEDLRRVAHGLYPPTLERFGVVEAVRSACRHTHLPVRIVDEGIGRHTPAVESTLYFCCVEALQNAAKHAGPGASATVRIGADDATVWFAVDDDGAGFDTALARGTGLGNLRDRVAAMGGSLDVESAPGSGTRLAGRFPAQPAVTAR